jgi:hypothetical protein
MKLGIPLFVSCLTAFTLNACAQDQPAAARQSPEALEARQETLERKSLQRVDVTSDARITGEVPEAILDTLREDLAARGVNNAQLVHAEATVWPNGAMGCPEPGRMYTQALIEGYRVIFENAEDRWDYRVSQNGGFVLCERISPLQQRGVNPAK